MACMRAQSTLQLPRRLLQARSSFAQHRNELPNASEKSFLEGQILQKCPVLLTHIYHRSKTADRPIAPWPHHKPDSSHFGSASPKWYVHTELQTTQCWDGGSNGHTIAVQFLPTDMDDCSEQLLTTTVMTIVIY